ncbi:MAG TPA: DivIVA domain-containing protein [Streptosporangiaceae bacterium]|jgi:DivIVA domain-containing protein
MDPWCPRRLTPEAAHSVSFRPARFGHRGFDEEPVREFCERVEAELVMLLNERQALLDEVSHLRRRAQVGQDGGSAAGLGQAHRQAVSILSQAQRTADHCVAEAQEYGRHLTEQACHLRDEILAEARPPAGRAGIGVSLDAARGAASQG